MPEIQVKCPAKINLTLEVLDKRPDGFHNIQSVMQTISLYDILSIKIEQSDRFKIELSGTSDEIPYDEKNLVHKAAMLYLKEINKENEKFSVSIHIEKNIPIAAGLAGGSTDAAGTLWGLNKLFNNVLTQKELHALCAKLGSDLNFCLEGGCQLTTGRGEILKPLAFQEFRLSLIKPKHLGISAKEAYTKFSELENKHNLNATQKLIDYLNDSELKNKVSIAKYLHNDLEIPILRDYEELQLIKKAYPKSIMSGSGSTYFVIEDEISNPLGESYWTKTNLKSIKQGVSQV